RESESANGTVEPVMFDARVPGFGAALVGVHRNPFRRPFDELPSADNFFRKCDLFEPKTPEVRFPKSFKCSCCRWRNARTRSLNWHPSDAGYFSFEIIDRKNLSERHKLVELEGYIVCITVRAVPMRSLKY